MKKTTFITPDAPRQLSDGSDFSRLKVQAKLVANPRDEVLDIPGATKLSRSDWEELFLDAASMIDEYLLNDDELAAGLHAAGSDDLRAFAKWFVKEQK